MYALTEKIYSLNYPTIWVAMFAYIYPPIYTPLPTLGGSTIQL